MVGRLQKIERGVFDSKRRLHSPMNVPVVSSVVKWVGREVVGRGKGRRIFGGVRWDAEVNVVLMKLLLVLRAGDLGAVIIVESSELLAIEGGGGWCDCRC